MLLLLLLLLLLELRQGVRQLMTIVLFLENGHGACVSSLCVPALCGALCLLQPQIRRSSRSPGRRVAAVAAAAAAVSSIYTVSTLYLHYLPSVCSIYGVSTLTLPRRRQCSGGDAPWSARSRGSAPQHGDSHYF